MGELRFIARLLKSSVPNGIPQSDVQGGTAIEGTDVFLVNGQTRSKFYSSVCSCDIFDTILICLQIRFIQDQVHGVSLLFYAFVLYIDSLKGDGLRRWCIHDYPRRRL